MYAKSLTDDIEISTKTESIVTNNPRKMTENEIEETINNSVTFKGVARDIKAVINP